MSCKGEEGVAIASLIADDGDHVVGWVYLWSTTDLGIRWVDRKHSASFIAPPISAELLAAAAEKSSSEVVDFLMALQPQPSLNER